MSAQQALALPSPALSSTALSNARPNLRIEADRHGVLVAGIPVHRCCAQDVADEAYATVFLVGSGVAQPADVPRAFDGSGPTVRLAGTATGDGRCRMTPCAGGSIVPAASFGNRRA